MKTSTLIPVLILVAVAAIMAAVPASPQDAVKPPAREQAEASAQKIKELQKERIATLERVVESLTRLYQSRHAEYREVVEARLLLLQAELDVAEKGADRIALYKEAINSLKQYEEFANVQVQSGRETRVAVLKIKARRLEVEIQLEQAKLKEANEGQ